MGLWRRTTSQPISEEGLFLVKRQELAIHISKSHSAHPLPIPSSSPACTAPTPARVGYKLLVLLGPQQCRVCPARPGGLCSHRETSLSGPRWTRAGCGWKAVSPRPPLSRKQQNRTPPFTASPCCGRGERPGRGGLTGQRWPQTVKGRLCPQSPFSLRWKVETLQHT